ncbi:MAG: hypothetical protein ACREXT_15445, partial [Gammaproteobacteria bacterium]
MQYRAGGSVSPRHDVCGPFGWFMPCILLLLLVPQSAAAITINIEFVDDGEAFLPPGYAPVPGDPNTMGPLFPPGVPLPVFAGLPQLDRIVGTGDLKSVFEAAAQAWETALPNRAGIDPATVTLRVGWGTQTVRLGTSYLIEQVKSPIDGIWRETKAVVVAGNDIPAIVGGKPAQLYLDPTLDVHSEFDQAVLINRVLPGNPNAVGTGIVLLNPAPLVMDAVDIYRFALHEIGHALGLSYQNQEFFNETSGQGDIEIDVFRGTVFDGIRIGLQESAGGFEDHIDRAIAGGALLATRGFSVSRGTRLLPSQLDILAVSEPSDWNNVATINLA